MSSGEPGQHSDSGESAPSAALSATPSATPSAAGPARLRSVLLLLLVGVAITLAITIGDRFSLEALAEQEAALRFQLQAHPLPTFLTAFLIYAVVTGFAIPVATPLSLAYAWLFGFWPALVVVSFASTTGASLSFLLSRHFLAGFVRRRFANQLQRFQQAIETDGAYFLFSLRLVPYVPFFVVNLVMGLTRMRLRSFWWISQLGMLPGTMTYLFAGSSVGSIRELAARGVSGIVTPQLLLAFTLLGLFPLAAKWCARRLRRSR